jgi:alpha-tubulin suppressor-like RCC1 family protein
VTISRSFARAPVAGFALLTALAGCARPSTTLLVRVRSDFEPGAVASVRAHVAWIDARDAAIGAVDGGAPTYELTRDDGEIVRVFPGTIVVAPRVVRADTPVDVELWVTPRAASEEPFSVRARVRFARERTSVIDLFVPSRCATGAVRERCALRTITTGVEHTCAGEGEDPCVPLVEQSATPYAPDVSAPPVDTRIIDTGVNVTLDASADVAIDAGIDSAQDVSVDVPTDVPNPCSPACSTMTERCVAGRCYLKPFKLALGDAHTCAAIATGAYCWGRNARGQLGRGSMSAASPTPGLVLNSNGPLIATLSSRREHSCLVTRAATSNAACWGENSDGQLGNSSSTPSATPAIIGSVVTAVAIAAGGRHSCVLDNSGEVYCAGANDFGQLGRPAMGATRAMFAPITALAVPYIAVAAGDDFTCALPRSPTLTVACWGRNDVGQLGDGTMVDSAAPVTVAALTGDLLTAGSRHACSAQTMTGAISCWGDNSDGQLGDGTTTNRPTPVSPMFALLTRAKKIAAGTAHTCMIDTTDSLWCWGRNDFGQLGVGSISARITTPQRVAIGPVDEVVCGARHTCARTIGSDVWCWGDNSDGQLGDGTTTPSSRPVSALPFP